MVFPRSNLFVFKNPSFFNKSLLRITHNLTFGDLSNSRHFRLGDKSSQQGRKKVTIVLLPTQTVIVAHAGRFYQTLVSFLSKIG
jgi:hypothetical protein